MISKSEKLGMSYVVKADNKNSYKEIDIKERSVSVIANTYNYFDTDADVLLPGCCAKSITERGPASSLPGKIKHLANHDLTKGIGRIDLLEETKIDGNDVLHAYSYMSETDAGEEVLIKYNEGIIDQHSIGFQYLNLEFIEAESTEWDKFLKNLINPDVAEKMGFGWAVKEIMLYEFSSLDGFGANRLTPYLGSKSANKNVQYNNMITKLDALHTAMRQGVKDKFLLELQEKQIKQMIYELYNQEPNIKDTLKKEPFKKNTFDITEYLNTHKILK